MQLISQIFYHVTIYRTGTRAGARGEIQRPVFHDPSVEFFRKLGIQHALRKFFPVTVLTSACQLGRAKR
jgi:hypothetical protein